MAVTVPRMSSIFIDPPLLTYTMEVDVTPEGATEYTSVIGKFCVMELVGMYPVGMFHRIVLSVSVPGTRLVQFTVTVLSELSLYRATPPLPSVHPF